ncbi:MAG TPA: hypothetical protein VF331_12210 [Polyangiales bacterium]
MLRRPVSASTDGLAPGAAPAGTPARYPHRARAERVRAPTNSSSAASSIAPSEPTAGTTGGWTQVPVAHTLDAHCAFRLQLFAAGPGVPPIDLREIWQALGLEPRA